jgi:hypothetical protein
VLDEESQICYSERQLDARTFTASLSSELQRVKKAVSLAKSGFLTVPGAQAEGLRVA